MRRTCGWHSVTGVAADRVGACHVGVAVVRAGGALIDVSVCGAIALKAGVAGACEAADRVGACRVGVAVVRAGGAAVNAV